MKKAIRKVCVFLLAAIFLGKSLYGDVQYAVADEYDGREVTVAEGALEDLQGEDVSSNDVSSNDISSNDVSTDDVAIVDEESNGDVSENEYTPGTDTEEDIATDDVSENNTDIQPEVKVVTKFYTLKRGRLSLIAPEITGESVVHNDDENYIPFYVFVEGSEYSLDYYLNNFEEFDYSIFAQELTDGVVEVVLPEGYENFKTISEWLGTNKEYGPDGKEYTIEDIIGQKDFIGSLFTLLEETGADGEVTGNIIYETGDLMDWYVLKDADGDLWHTDGLMTKAKVLVAAKNKPVGTPATYTYDGKSVISAEDKIVKKALDKADDALPGTYYAESVVYKDASGNVVTEAVNAGKYTAVATVVYAYQKDGDELSYESAPFEVVFPITVNKRTVTVTAHDGSKNEGQDDPTFTGTVSGAVSSDPVSAFFWRIQGNERAGKYPIYSTIVASSNYNVVSYDGTFTINAVEQPPIIEPTPIPPTEEEEEETPPNIPEEVIEEETFEMEDDDVPLASADIVSDDDTISLGGEGLDVEDVYPALRDLTIEDDETPLASFDDCWIHWLIVLLTVLDVLYTVIQAFRNGAEIKKLKKENE